MTKNKKLLGISFLAGIILIFVIVKIVFFPSLSQRLKVSDDFMEARNELSGTRVALYFGSGMDSHSAIALGRAFLWMGCGVEFVDASRIKNGDLDRFDVLACPGGASRPNPWRELGLEGKSIIQSFIKNGGGYVGICFGALYASDYSEFWGARIGEDDLYLDLFPGVAYCGQEAIAPQGGLPLMTWLKIVNNTHPITESLPERIRIVCYPNGPYLEPYDGANVTIIADYEITGNPAMVAFEYGRGRVFLSGPHPEIEVDSDRDGSRRFQDLSDEGSEWPLLLAVMKWLTDKN